MAPKKKEHSHDLRALVIKHFQTGDSQREIAAKVLLPRETVRDIINKYKRTKCIGNLFGRGRKRKTTTTTDRSIQRMLKKERRISAGKVRADVDQLLGISLSTQTIRNRAHEIGLYGRLARKKPFVNKVNRGKRLKYANDMLQKPLDYWDTVIWSDESKFTVFPSNGRVMVWRNTEEAFDPKCIAPTVKHGGASVMVWGCFTRRGVGKLHILDRTMDRFYYREILEKNLLPSIGAFGFSNGFAFMHDNDPKHTAGIVKDWLIRKGISVLPWPPYSPDLNPIEHLWEELERRLKKRHPKNKQELVNVLMDEWSKIDLSVLHKLVDSVPNRLYECVRVKGYPTKY